MFKDVETSVILLYIGGAGVLLYMLFSWLQNQDASAPPDAAGQKISLLSALTGQSSIDPTTGQSNGLIDSVMNYVFTTTNPGGGQVPNTSETPLGAYATFYTSPIQSTCAILGGSCPNW